MVFGQGLHERRFLDTFTCYCYGTPYFISKFQYLLNFPMLLEFFQGQIYDKVTSAQKSESFVKEFIEIHPIRSFWIMLVQAMNITR